MCVSDSESALQVTTWSGSRGLNVSPRLGLRAADGPLEQTGFYIGIRGRCGNQPMIIGP